MISKIVVTGGPCAGKSTALSKITETFTKLGYEVLCVPESATELILGGVSAENLGTVLFQQSLLKLQLAQEKIFEDSAKQLESQGKKVLIVCDRGIMDGKAYLKSEEFYGILGSLGLKEVQARDGYDAVFHLVTAANGAMEFYTLKNNAARSETAERACAVDNALISAWTGHPHLRIIKNGNGGFDEKMADLISEISTFLGEPKPIETERKYLIEYPDINWLENNPNCQKTEIIQTYLTSAEGEELRIRQRGIAGDYVFFKTRKIKISELKRIEEEERISQSEYNTLLMCANPNMRPIRKTRYCLTYEGQYFEIDLYPFWKDKAILEIELRDEEKEIVFPSEIIIKEEVTDNPAYKNYALAKTL